MSGFNFSAGLTSGMSFLKRRFSSGDLQGELQDAREQESIMSTFRGMGPSPSAPSSPSKTSTMQGITRSLFQSQKPTYNKDHCKILLVIDDQHTDW